MPDPAAFSDSLAAIASRTDDDMSERDVENLFLETGFYDAFGYEGTGTDIRSEFTLPDDRRPDYITLDTNEAVNGRKVKSGERTTIPIPRSDTGVETLLEALHSDEETVPGTDINELEVLVSDVVYEMFGITSEEQDVIEDYLETFRVY